MTQADHMCQSVFFGALRWLHAINLDPYSRTYGVCDREFWAWKVKDFANGTWQCGLAGFLDAQELLSFSKTQQRAIVQAVIRGTRTIQREDGSFEEAYPLESSYCVSALVQFALLYCALKYPDLLTECAQHDLRLIVIDSNRFLETNTETHGLIANHRATALMARHLAAKYLNLLPVMDSEYLEFAQLQHPCEGWLPEYGEADPGYQTLLNYYLAAAHAIVPLPAVLQTLYERSRRFTSHFCLPDGSFAGEVGGRGTSIVYPGGLLALNGAEDHGAMMTWFTRLYASGYQAITPVTVDTGNFAPVFNSWAFAWRQRLDGFEQAIEDVTSLKGHVSFPDAGLYRLETEQAVALVSSRNGAIRLLVCQDGSWQDKSLVALCQRARTTQGGEIRNFSINEHSCSFQVSPIARNQSLNTPFRAVILRLLALFLHRLPGLHRILKKILVRFVMRTRVLTQSTPITISIDLKQPDCPVSVEAPDREWQRMSFGYHKHMASANTFELRSLQAGEVTK